MSNISEPGLIRFVPVYAEHMKVKRLCRSSETVICTSHPPSKCAEDYDSMELDLKQNNPTEFLNPQKMKEKPTLLIFPNNETRTPVQPCPRCIAGEPGHFSHIMNL
ncbi:uncharacterized protein C10orf143 homolog isoform X2 [Anolis sagrei]|uniref:uncharacterized protein C10orf143 homolog isoform X2 n=1 Tax=Anolis sagrei TaxID=38937 RepID=UPI00351FC2CA